jgi:hypothetical protein
MAAVTRLEQTIMPVKMKQSDLNAWLDLIHEAMKLIDEARKTSKTGLIKAARKAEKAILPEPFQALRYSCFTYLVNNVHSLDKTKSEIADNYKAHAKDALNYLISLVTGYDFEPKEFKDTFYRDYPAFKTAMGHLFNVRPKAHTITQPRTNTPWRADIDG